jgi:hypothetical protein
MIFNATEVLIDNFVEKLHRGYQRMFGNYNSNYSEIIVWAGRMAMENIANGDALYHNTEHTILVTLVGQEILVGKHMSEGGVSCEDWLHFTISLLCHDIGYIKGVCQADQKELNRFVTGKGSFVDLPPGASDAALSPYHIDRGKLFVKERFDDHALICYQTIIDNIERTRFPVPSSDDAGSDHTFADLLRAADLIGQLGDPRYLQKLHALFHEFEEIGANAKMGFKTTDDLRRGYPGFYWNCVFPFLGKALSYLDITQNGKQIIANLYANVFRQEHARTVESCDVAS